MTKVTLKDIKDLQAALDEASAVDYTINRELDKESGEGSRIASEIRQCHVTIDELSIIQDADEEMSMITAQLGRLNAEQQEFDERHRAWYPDWFLRHSDAWKKCSRISAKLNKLKSKYWKEHGIQN